MKYGFEKAKRDFQRRYCIRALRAAGLSVTRAAVLADVNRTWFHDLMKMGRVKLSKISPREVYRVKTYREEFEAFSRRLFTRALTRSNFSATATARYLGIDRTHVYRMAKRLGVGLIRRQDENEGNAAWRALAGSSPAPQQTQADALASP